LTGKSEGNRPFGKLRRKLENFIIMDLKEIRWEDVDWMLLVQDRTSGCLL
jgi:hypothetical protein